MNQHRATALRGLAFAAFHRGELTSLDLELRLAAIKLAERQHRGPA
jgi:hypothetical protein